MRKLVSVMLVAAAVLSITSCNLIPPDWEWPINPVPVVPVVPVEPGDPPPVENHRAMFLYNNAALRMMNILSPMLTRDAFKGYVDMMKSDGADMCYLFIINERDGGWTPYSFYQGNNIGGTINQGVVDEYKARMDYIRSKDMGIIIVLRPDDSPNFVRTLDQYVNLVKGAPTVSLTTDLLTMRFSVLSTASQEQYQRDAVRLFDMYASGYWAGLELDEYYNIQQVDHYAKQLQGLTEKPIGTHQLSDRYNFAKLDSVDHCYFQYGWNKSPAHMQSRTSQVVADLNKPVIAAEHNKTSNSAEARAQGDAAMAGGAYATGNGRN